jgi:hypothetical protein
MSDSNAILDAFFSLGKKVNKVLGRSSDEETEQGIVSEKFPELTLEMKNEDLGDLTDRWQKKWKESSVFSEWDKHGDDNEAYWLGNQHIKPKVEKTRPTIDNVLFEALETYLPEATRRNPDPMVNMANKDNDGNDQVDTPEVQAFIKGLQNKLKEINDDIKLRLRLKRSARHWAIYLLGAAKPGWDMDKDIPTAKIIRPKKLILDPDATVDEDGYNGKYYGEYRKMEAGKMITTMEKIGGESEGIKLVKDMAGDDLGTEIQFIEWWTTDYMCWTMKKVVLLKKKNPHWNYETTEDAPADATTGEVPMDENGKPQQVPKPAQPNHFKSPRIPLILLTVFNLGKQPVDDTSLMGQNISTQDRINKRSRQIDRNADSMNNGMVVSLERSGLIAPQAKNVTKSLRDGGTVVIPTGDVNEAMSRMSAPPLPHDVYQDLTDQRNRLAEIFGSRGLTPSGLGSNKTVRGMMFEHNLATDRIGGGVSEYLEQFADDIVNWFIQMLYVYDNFYATDQTPRPVVKAGVKEGSMLPKDSASLAAQALDLAKANKMSLIDLFKALDKPNPEELAANVWLEVNAPEILFAKDPRVAQVVQMKQQAAAGGAKPPNESINFKDLPPDGKVQMAKKVGIDLHAEGVAAHEEHAATRGRSNPAIPEVGAPEEGAPAVQ